MKHISHLQAGLAADHATAAESLGIVKTVLIFATLLLILQIGGLAERMLP